MQPIRTAAEIPVHIKTLPVQQPPLYQKFAQKAIELHLLGMTYKAIAETLNISEKTIGYDYYDASYGKMEGDSVVQLVETSPTKDKAPLTTHARSGLHALEIEWKMVNNGHWELVISDDGWAFHNSKVFNAIRFCVNAPASGGPVNSLPQLMLRDKDSNFTGAVDMSNFISSIDSDEASWQEVIIPLFAFPYDPNLYDPIHFSAIRFMDGPDMVKIYGD